MTFLRVMVFSLVVLLSYTLFANILPQVQSNPPEEEKIDTGSLDQAGFIAWGEKLFSGKGTCTLCHNDLGRAPDLLKMDLRKAFAERLADAKYAGAAKDQSGARAIEIYLRESFVDPSAYVVPGFGKKGSNDTVSPMPSADKAPLSLKPVEIDALIAFLQAKAGFDVTVKLPSADAGAPKPAADDEEGGGKEDEDEEDGEGPAATAKAAIEKFTCGACHDLFGSEAETGPKLAGLGKKLGREGLRKAILDPNATLAEGFEADMMPTDYGEQMRVKELDLIVEYLMTLKEEG